MKILITLLVVFATKSLASTILGSDYAQKFCQKSVRTSGNATYITPTVVYHDRDFLVMSLSQNHSSEISFISQVTGEVFTKRIEEKIIDFTSSPDSLYALGPLRVYQFAKGSLDLVATDKTMDEAHTPTRYQIATGISYEEGLLYISHGELGAVIRDARTLKQVRRANFKLQTNRGHRSQLSDIDVKDGKVLLGVDNVTGSPDGTRGLEGYFLGSIHDLEKAKFKSIDSTREALDHPYVYLFNDHFYAINWFYLFDYKISDMNRRGPLRPSGRYWNFDSDFNFFGRPAVNEQEILGCAKNSKNEVKFLALPRPGQ